jgi:hypothetical protein
MNRAELLEKLRELKPWLEEQGIGNPRLYGSFARDEAGPESDVDLMVDIIKRPMGWEIFGIEEELGEKLGGRRVEFAFEEAMHRFVLA